MVTIYDYKCQDTFFTAGLVIKNQIKDRSRFQKKFLAKSMEQKLEFFKSKEVKIKQKYQAWQVMDSESRIKNMKKST